METRNHYKNGAYPKSHMSRNLKITNMKKYLIKGSYNSDGLKGLMEEGGSGRRSAIEKMLGQVGGKVESFYYAFGETDVYVIAEMPNDISAAGIALTVNASGLVKITMTALLSATDIDAASKVSVGYRAPGKN